MVTSALMRITHAGAIGSRRRTRPVVRTLHRPRLSEPLATLRTNLKHLKMNLKCF